MNTKEKMKEMIIRDVLLGGTDPAGEVYDLVERLSGRKTGRPVVYVGAGTCGMGAGAGKSLDAIHAYLSGRGIGADVVSVGCIGLCSSEPLVDVFIPGYNRLSFEQATAEIIPSILDRVFDLREPGEGCLFQFDTPGLKRWENVPLITEHPFFAPQMRVVLANCGIINPVSIEEYIATGGYKSYLKVIQNLRPEQVADKIEKSGLRGRGGGGYPAAWKWKQAAAMESDQRYLICNADEGDPGAFMDRAIIEGDPHRLIEGMAIAAHAIRASKAYIYIRAEYPLAIERLRMAIAQAAGYGLLGHNILGSGVDFEITLKMGAGAFVCGEETALMHSIEGKRGMPRPRPPFPTVSGLFGRPTVINNVETLANVPGIIARGETWFSALGTPKSKGTKVFALSGKITRTGLVEIPMGTSLKEIIFNIGGGTPGGKKFKAVQIGGPSGGCITGENLDIRIDYESLLGVGAMMGSGGLVVMDEDTCMVDIARYFMDFIQRESCGKCIPCREGTRRMLEILESITRKPANGEEALERFKGVMQLEKLGRIIRDTSLCGLGKSAPNPVLSTIKWFREEYEAHVYDRICPAGACSNLRIFRIEPGTCTGCTACIKKCPAGAIVGVRKSPHIILGEKCIGCGSCQAACAFKAIDVVNPVMQSI